MIRIVVLLIFFNLSEGLAQTKVFRPNVIFLTDSIAIGHPFRLALTYRHSPKTEVFFPDTTYRFTPFEVLGYEYYDTRTDQRGSLDSAVYTLVPFELANPQSISLPIWVYNGRDCTAVYSENRTISLKRLLKQSAADTAHLKTLSNIVPLNQQVNYPFLLLILLSLLILGTGIYLIFGSQIQRQWRIYQLFLRNREFRRALIKLSKNKKGTEKIKELEDALILWKTYMQRLEKKPFMTFTTKEILDELPNEDLALALKKIDEVVYGGVSSTKTEELVNILRTTAQESYQKRRVDLRQ